jgi:transposase
MLTYGVVLLSTNARPHTAARTRAMLEHFNWAFFDHHPYSPDLAPSDYHLFYLPEELAAITAHQH